MDKTTGILMAIWFALLTIGFSFLCHFCYNSIDIQLISFAKVLNIIIIAPGLLTLVSLFLIDFDKK